MDVKLVSNTSINEDYFSDIVDDVDGVTAGDLIIYIARISSSRSNSEKLEETDKLIKYLIDHKHWSPFQMVYMCVEVTTSRAIAHQLIRHQSFDFQEFSQRYAEVTEFEDVELREQPDNNRQSSGKVFNPKIIDGYDSKAFSIIKDHLDIDVMGLYQKLLESGVARETARFILPLCTQTTLYMNGSLRSWIHFLDIRDDEHAQKEARLIAQEIGKIFQQQYPVIGKALDFNY